MLNVKTRRAQVGGFLCLLPLWGCGGLDGFESNFADLAQKSIEALPNADGEISFVSGPATISTRNAVFAAGFPAIFDFQVVDPEVNPILISWEHDLNVTDQCIERFGTDNSYTLECGERTGELFVYMTYQKSFRERTIVYQTVIESYRSVTDTDVFPLGR